MGIRIEKGQIRMPGRRALAIRGVDIEDRGAALKRRYCRMWLWLAYQSRECFMTNIIQMLLPSEKDYFVLEDPSRTKRTTEGARSPDK